MFLLVGLPEAILRCLLLVVDCTPPVSDCLDESGVFLWRHHHCTMVLHAHILPGGLTIGLLVAAVQRCSLTPSTWSSSAAQTHYVTMAYLGVWCCNMLTNRGLESFLLRLQFGPKGSGFERSNVYRWNKQRKRQVTVVEWLVLWVGRRAEILVATPVSCSTLEISVQMWSVAANVLNKQLLMTEKRWCSSLVVREGLTAPRATL
jgi:hypothetical protein